MSRIATALCLGLAFAVSGFAQSAAQVTGTVTDESGGVLPGVTIIASSRDGRVLATAVSTAAGAFTFDGMPAIPVQFSFQLDGFSPASTDAMLSSSSIVHVTQRLTVAGRSENVTVVGTAPPLPRPPDPVAVAAPPPPIVVPVAEHARESVCGPTKLNGSAAAFGTIRSRQFGAENGLYFAGDQLIVDRGAADGLAAGQNFVARRTFTPARGSAVPAAEHTAGLVQVVDTSEHTASIVVIYACDEVIRGDTLAAFKPEPVVPTEPAGVPAFDDASRILFADEGQLVGVPRRLMVVDRGQEQGVHAGQRFTIFRRAKNGADYPVVLGDAVVVAVRSDSSTIRIEHASDAITFDDLVAPHRHASPVR
jgi:Carboxypeptidase regulatory-like domain